MPGPSLRAWPPMPDGIEDRDADVWEALITVADAAGGVWPGLARAAAVSLVSDSKGGTHSLGIQLLGDLRKVFGDDDVMPTSLLLLELCAMDDGPWGDLKGKPLDARGLSNRLRQYGVTRKQVRIGDKTHKGYRREDLYDAWSRYLCVPPMEPETSETAGTTPANMLKPHDPRARILPPPTDGRDPANTKG